MVSCIREKLRNMDRFAQPILLNYKHEDSFKSACGGTLSLLVGLMTLIYVIQAVWPIFIEPEFTVDRTSNFVNFAENTDRFNFYTTFFNLAASISDDSSKPHAQDVIDSWVRIQYYLAQKSVDTGEEIVYKWLNTTTCIDFYNNL